jgi:hypothetical protein
MMSLLVGLALAACAVIAVIDGQDVLGLAAANFWTKLGFAVAGGVLLVNALMPRTTRRREVATAGATTTDAPQRHRRFSRGERDDADAPTTVGERPVGTNAADAPTTTHRRP